MAKLSKLRVAKALLKQKSSPLAHDSQLIKMALVVAKLENRAKQQRKDLKETTRELKFKRKELRAYAQSLTDTPVEPGQVPPMRLFGEV